MEEENVNDERLEVNVTQRLTVKTPYCDVTISVLNGITEVAAIRLPQGTTVEHRHVPGSLTATMHVRPGSTTA